ncbi:MIZ/SP-RING zinc finger-domain-containing protein [Ilyonectria sp. MPI-CAGE-AT-0026]|nr:MIZ/SP-RING zinc finger-domain-containing protein [Ilyonectria sp. MPI-CAGE-AT-0026]
MASSSGSGPAAAPGSSLMAQASTMQLLKDIRNLNKPGLRDVLITLVERVSYDAQSVEYMQQIVTEALQARAANSTKRRPASNPPPPATSGGSATKRCNATRRVLVTATSTQSLERPVCSILGSLGVPRHQVESGGDRSIIVELNVDNYPHSEDYKRDEDERVMIFCTARDLVGQPQLLVNSNEVKVNLGWPKPVDVTTYLLFGKNDTNKIEFTYRSSKQITAFAVNRCTYRSSQELVNQIPQKISVQSVLQQFTKEAQSSDITITSRVISLMCPVSKKRLKTPCRGLTCAHIQCFDALSYVQLQIQYPNWVCPICDTFVPFSHLAVDKYIMDILRNAESNTVTIDSDGKWWNNETSDDKRYKRAASIVDLTLSPDDIRPAKRSKP